jgi:DNA helicase II / ATP-dependent DNA helicase PcrA
LTTIYPAQPNFKNESERKVYNYIRDHLPDYDICYFNYNLQIREFDILLMVPDVGMFILEIKGWTFDQIYKVQDNNAIITKPGNTELVWPSPLKQANEYRFRLIRKVEKELKKDLLVIPIVCYPNITKDEFFEKRLDIVSGEEVTLFSDDFFDDESLKSRILAIAESFKHIAKDSFSIENMIEVRKFFEHEEQIVAWLKKHNIKGELNLKKQNEREMYSLLTFISKDIPAGSLKKSIDTVINHWTRGTKIYFFTNNPEISQEVKKQLLEMVEELHLTKHFEKQIFNFFQYEIETNDSESFEIIDGNIDHLEKYREQLEFFDEETKFNLNQFEVEHAPINEHIVIKAGAGSGKTFSMISRINYLLYAHQLDASSLREAIYLITFTNEAARNMKKKLQQNFNQFYLLTRNFAFFELIETIEHMNISTIHSLAKKILQRYSVKMGLGKDVRIVTGKYERDQILAQTLDRYLIERTQEEPNFIPSLKLSMYHLQDRLKSMILKLENKNMDILNDELEFGRSPLKEFDELIPAVLERSERDLRDLLDERNTIRLSDLMIRLKSLVEELDSELHSGIKYLFVDEFQDTDDVQIELMKAFQEVLNFSFFVVGDIKQCIYRFRGAEDKAFDKLEEGTSLSFISFSLNKNYRSDKLLLEKFETAFQKWGSGPSPKLVYDPEDDRLTSHEIINKQEDDFYQAVDVEDGEVEFQELFIDELEKEYDLLSDKGTLAILVRENKEVDFVREIGLKRGIYIETDNGGSLYQSLPALDFYKLILALQNSRSPKHLFNIFSSNYSNKSLVKTELMKRRNDPKALLEYFHELGPIQKWAKYLVDLKKEPVLYVLREIILDTRPWEVYANKHSANGSNVNRLKTYYKRNLDQLFEKLSQVGEQDYLTINKIEQTLRIMIMTKQKEESRESFENVSEGTKKIVCMTVHKSKGLEFETVMLPFVNKDLEDTRKSGPLDVIMTNKKNVGYKLRIDEKVGKSNYIENNYYSQQKNTEKSLKVNEETRILYVALTRTIKRFIYFRYNDTKIVNSWQNLLKE